MIKNIRIKLLSQFKKKDSDNWIQGVLKSGLAIILFPFIIIFGLVIMFFALVISFFQKRDSTDNIENKVTEEPWAILTEFNGVTVWKKYRGEIRFGPVYLDIKSEPTISGLDDKIFGDWLYAYRQGFFLQQWNRTDTPNTSLVYLDTNDKKIKTIKDSINSVHWDMVEHADKKLELKCDTGHTVINYEIEM
jgi:hypothetical protein